MAATNWEPAFAEVIGHEGGFTADPRDRGNWTTGRIGEGELKGTKYGVSAMCLHPDTLVLKRDLSWVRNGDLVVGDELIGFVKDHKSRGMRLEPSSVILIDQIALPAIEIETEKRTVVASVDHMWWATRPKGTSRAYEWILTRDLRPGDAIAQYRAPWQFDASPGAQWLAGLIDGEGHLGPSQLSIYQNEGPVADRIRVELTRLGYHWSEEARLNASGKSNIKFCMTGCAFQLVGTLRPTRMLAKAESFWRGRCTHGRYNALETVVSVRDAGVRPVMAMLTSTGTFIAEGLLSHNSYPDTNIRDLTLAEAKAIYRRDYWAKVRGDDLPPGIDLVVFDLSVNSGPGSAAEYLQKAVGVPADGKIGPITLYAADNADPLTVIDRICDRRLAFMRGLSTWPVYGKGWSARVLRVRTIAKQWSGASRPAPPPDDPGPEIIVITPTTPAVPWWRRWLNTLGYLRRL